MQLVTHWWCEISGRIPGTIATVNNHVSLSVFHPQSLCPSICPSINYLPSPVRHLSSPPVVPVPPPVSSSLPPVIKQTDPGSLLKPNPPRCCSHDIDSYPSHIRITNNGLKEKRERGRRRQRVKTGQRTCRVDVKRKRKEDKCVNFRRETKKRVSMRGMTDVDKRPLTLYLLLSASWLNQSGHYWTHGGPGDTTSFPHCARMTNIHLWLNVSFYKNTTVSHTTVRGRDFLRPTFNLTDKQIHNWSMHACVRVTERQPRGTGSSRYISGFGLSHKM